MHRKRQGSTRGTPARILGRGFVWLWLSSLCTYAGFQFLTASLPLYALQLGADDAALGLLIGFIAAVALITRPLAGWWIDRANSTLPLAVGAFIFAVCALGYWQARSVTTLLTLRAATGLAIAFYGTASQTLAANLSPAERRGEAMSLFALALTLSQGVGPPAGVALAERIGYPGLFLTCAAVNLAGVAFAAGLHTLRPDPAARRHGRVLNWKVLLPGVLLLTLNVAFGVNFALLAVHASRRGLVNPGLVFVAHACGVFAAQSIAGRLSDRLGRLAVIVPGLVLAAVGLWGTALAAGAWLFVAGALSGLGLGGVQPLLYALAADLVPLEERGSAVGTIGIFHEIGIVLGAIGGGFLGRSIGLPAMYGIAGTVPASGAMLALLATRRRRARA
ncbi:MAG: MFS transporter [Firmicutes bacterium]|nr:MFS transporter [Bacillota bacterium]